MAERFECGSTARSWQFSPAKHPNSKPRRDLGHACSVGLSESLARRTRLLPISCCAMGLATLDMAKVWASCCADSGIASPRPSTDTKLIPQSSPVALSGAILLLYVLTLRNGTFPTIRENYPVLHSMVMAQGAFSENQWPDSCSPEPMGGIGPTTPFHRWNPAKASTYTFTPCTAIGFSVIHCIALHPNFSYPDRINFRGVGWVKQWLSAMASMALLEKPRSMQNS
jgi:hypothetical protein